MYVKVNEKQPINLFGKTFSLFKSNHVTDSLMVKCTVIRLTQGKLITAKENSGFESCFRDCNTIETYLPRGVLWTMARPYVAIDEKVSDRLGWTWVSKATRIVCLWSIDFRTVHLRPNLYGVYKFKG